MGSEAIEKNQIKVQKNLVVSKKGAIFVVEKETIKI
jgi:hypothetical protein